METITHHKYSTFRLEKPYSSNIIGGSSYNCTISCFEYIETYPTLVEAQEAQKGYDFKTLIIPTY